jgi:hypothetical protein
LRALSLYACCRHYPGAAAGRRHRSSHPAVTAFPDNVVGSACTSSFSRPAQRIAVGTPIAGRPPHRSGQARFRHPAPTSGCLTSKRSRASFALRLSVRGPAPGSRAPGSVSGACFADPRSPWSPALAPPAPQPVARLCSSASRLLCRSLTSLGRASAATAPHLPVADHVPKRAYGRSRDLPVPAQGASIHARVLDHAGLAGRSR